MRIRSSEHRVLVADRVEANENEPRQPQPDVVLAPEDARLSRYARAAYDPDDPVARMARSLRLSIAASTRADAMPVRSVAILGVGAPFEASVVAANLAISYAQAATPTVLVDANLGSPAQHALLGLPQTAGLAAVLAGDDDARSLVEPSAVRNLSVLVAGRSGPDAAVLLDGERFHRRAMPLLDSYGMMVVDVGMTHNDPPTLCEAVDAAILIVRRGSTPVEAIRHVADRLGEMRTALVGTLLAT
ncbi:hypothetical protein [uncultured Sphingomonas sp.]|uniref:hypothetical protein n=1 Tax=uncultured Sphingomonas sp. TaxID=158754 RepID=UPI00261DB03C|nr:hypothetical protein [uncultured Sphingomonas sp.]